MKIRTAADLLAVVKGRGLKVRVDPGPPPMPVLIFPAGAKDDATEVLVSALRVWRLEIIEEVQRRSLANGIH